MVSFYKKDNTSLVCLIQCRRPLPLLSHVMRIPVIRISDQFRYKPGYATKMARGLKVRIYKVEGFYAAKKGADQLRSYHAADLHICFVHMQKAEFLMARLILQNEGKN